MRTAEGPPDTRKHTVLPVSIRLKSTEKTPACVSMRAFLQPISARIYFGKTASHRKRARLVQSRGASPQAYWMSVKAAQRRGCAKRAFCGVCFLMSGGLGRFFSVSINPRPCHSEPVTDVTGVGIRNLLAGNLRKSAGIVHFGNGLPRQSVPQGHLLRGAHWLAMTGFFDRLSKAASGCLAFFCAISVRGRQSPSRMR